MASSREAGAAASAGIFTSGSSSGKLTRGMSSSEFIRGWNSSSSDFHEILEQQYQQGFSQVGAAAGWANVNDIRKKVDQSDDH